MSGTTQAIKKYGVTNEFDYQTAKKLKEMGVAIEQALTYGVRNAATDATTGAPTRLMGGIGYYITTNVNTSTTLTEAALLDAMQTAFDAGGYPDRILLNSANKRTVSAFTTSGTLQVMRQDTQRGVVVDTFLTDFGQAAVILSRYLRKGDIYVFNRDQAQIRYLRPPQFEMLAKTGDSMSGMLLTEMTLQFERQRHAVKFTSVA